MRAFRFFAMISMFMLGVSTAELRADTVVTGTAVHLDVGPEYASPQSFWLNGVKKSGVGAGNIHDNTIYDVNTGEAIALDYMYCVDIVNSIAVPHDDYLAQVNTIGYIYNQDPPPSTGAQVSTLIPSNSPGAMNPDGTYGVKGLANAGQIGYLLTKYAVEATAYAQSPGGNENKELALQAAIWTEVYDINDGFIGTQINYSHPTTPIPGYNFVYNPTAAVKTLYEAYLTDVHTYALTHDMSSFVDDVLWINPYTKTTNSQGVTTYKYRQGQVGFIPAPLPGAFTMVLSFLGTVAAGGFNKRIRGLFQTAA